MVGMHQNDGEGVGTDWREVSRTHPHALTRYFCHAPPKALLSRVMNRTSQLLFTRIRFPRGTQFDVKVLVVRMPITNAHHGPHPQVIPSERRP